MSSNPAQRRATDDANYQKNSMPKSTNPTSAPASPRHEERIVLFLDFLGFKELVTRTTIEPAFLERVIKAIDIVGRIGSDNAELLQSRQLTQFSDCVVVSYAVTERSAVFWLLNDIALHVIELAEHGFLVRGGVTVGPVYHTTKHVLGPAMNEAYRLESQIAKYPRVVIDAAVLTVARRARNEDHSAQEEENYVRPYLTKDKDGQFYFDYVSWNSVVHIAGGSNELYGKYLRKLGTLVRDGLRHDDARVQEKYLWLRKLYVAAIRRVQDLPSDSSYRLENPALCEEISNLPVFRIDTKMARAAVKSNLPRTANSQPKKEKNKKVKKKNKARD